MKAGWLAGLIWMYFVVESANVGGHDDNALAILVFSAERVAGEREGVELGESFEQDGHLLHVVELVVGRNELLQVGEQADWLDRVQVVARYVENAELALETTEFYI